MRHYHVDEHDVGYLPEQDIETYLTLTDAWNAVCARIESHLDYCGEADLDDTVRGSSEWIYADEIQDVEDQRAQLDEAIRNGVAPKWNTITRGAIERDGLAIVLDAGIRVIELSPCTAPKCEAFRELLMEG